ncbi:F-box protein CPR1-like [Pyrus communis]|uniref:F-box protein CPR1-like n=1 Tax=Pyrus communis TaxID=23211 RepID=UPI0035C037A4
MSDYFPPELLFEILLLLPPKDLIRCMCVSKAWNACIRDGRFTKRHLQRSINTNSARTILFSLWGTLYPKDFFLLAISDDDSFSTAVEIWQPLVERRGWGEISILGSCNGLVCIKSTENAEIALWNPSIQKFKRIPFTPSVSSPQYGFGYDSTNDDYKLVEIEKISTPYSVDVSKWSWENITNGSWPYCVALSYEVHVYSLKSNLWKKIQSMPSKGLELVSKIHFSNGALNWVMSDNNMSIILTLDLATEKYGEFYCPVNGILDVSIELEVLGGYLCVCILNYNNSEFGIWVMKEYGARESWTLLHSSISHLCKRYKPLVFSKNGEMVLVRSESHPGLRWFDLEEEVDEYTETRGMPPHNGEATFVVGSLCLLDGEPVICTRQPRVSRGGSNRRSRPGLSISGVNLCLFLIVMPDSLYFDMKIMLTITVSSLGETSGGATFYVLHLPLHLLANTRAKELCYVLVSRAFGSGKSN